MRSTVLNNMVRGFRMTAASAIVGLAVLSTVLLFAGKSRAAAPGSLDLSFGVRGTAFLSLANFQDGRAIALQPDGKIVVAGTLVTCATSPCVIDFLIVRYNSNGTLDSSFGTNGTVVTDFSGQNDFAIAVAIQADGKIVAAGGSGAILGFKLARYLSDGTLDSTFGTGGRVVENFDNAGGNAYSVFIQPDGKIVAAGTDPASMLFVARFETNGGLDTGFGTGGKIATSAYDVSHVRMALQSDSKVLIAANSSPLGTLKLIRFNTNGTPDSDFGMGGVATSAFAASNFRPAVGLQADGKIVVSGFDVNHDMRNPPLKRFNQDGSVDSSLVPNHGEVGSTGTCAGCTQQVTSIVVLADGRFYLVGWSQVGGGNGKTIAVTRYLNSGSLDWNFGYHGVSFFERKVGNDADFTDVGEAKVQADGKVVFAATAGNPNGGLLAIRLNSAVTPPTMRGDFDGDGRTEFAVFRPSDQFWYLLMSSDSSTFSARWGLGTDVIAPADYRYTGKAELAVYRPSQRTWWVYPGLPFFGNNPGGPFGQVGDIPVQEDYDGDGMTDLANYRPATGAWNIRYSLRTINLAFPYERSFAFGVSTDRPVPADYDGDGRADIAVFRPSEGNWYILRSSDGFITGANFGIETDKTVQGDYDGDLKTDIAVYRDGAWYILRSSDGGFVGINWGLATDKPVPGDYDGDGKFDVAVYRPSEGVWYVLRSSDSGIVYGHFGLSEDIPIPNAFVR